MRYRLHVTLATVALVAVMVFLAYGGIRPQSHPSSFTIGNSTFDFTAYAFNSSSQLHGLMNTTVTNSTLMLFGFGAPGVYPFWMKDTYYPLDIFWIYSQSGIHGRIVYEVEAAPCVSYDPSQSSCLQYTPPAEANYVVEAPAGFLRAHNVTQYENVTFVFS